MKDRLLINILTTNSLILNGQAERFENYAQKAWETLIKVLFSYNQNKFLNRDQLIELMCQDPYTHENKKRFLCYDFDNKILIKKIEKDLDNLIKDLRERQVFEFKNNLFRVNHELSKEFVDLAAIQKKKIS